jgi:hypothetical protein
MSLSGSKGAATLSISGDGLFANTTYTLVVTASDNAGNKATSGGGSLEVLGCIT